MHCPLERMDKRVFQEVKAIGRSADKEGLGAFLIGGIVRDILLKRDSVDVDVVIEGDAVAFARKVAAQRGLLLKTYGRFGTATVSGPDGLHIDLVSARSETYPYPGALPVVRRAALREDVFRRDFTLNALAVCINQKDFGRMVDLCGGLEDLKKGIVRVFHDKSFWDDPTRILRAVRFEQRFGFRMAPKTLRLLKLAVAEKACQTVSSPRYFQEFARGLTEDSPGKYIRRLWSLGALDFLGLRGGVPVSAVTRLDSMIACRRKIFQGDPVRQKLIYLSALYAGETETDILRFGARFQWPRSEKKRLVEMIGALPQGESEE